MDVVRSNFEEVFPQIKKVLQKSDFVGLSAFVKSQEFPNTYEAHTFNFHLFPSSFGQMDTRFLCQASSLEFLCNHKFDYNKFIYEGVPFLSKTQRAELHELCLKDQVRIASTLHKDIERDFVVPQCKKIEEWLKENKTKTLELNCPGAFLQFLLYQEIREKFDKLSCKVQMNGKLLITKVENEQNLSDQKQEILKIVEQSCGFSRVFDILVKLKKPLVGHNLLTDILFIYEKFHYSLPDNYENFKREIHELFPCIIDTKRFALDLNKHNMLSETDVFRKTNLEDLHGELSCHKGLYYVLYTPTIIHSKSCQKYANSKSLHEAGYDAYISGYVFLRMAHILTVKTLGSNVDGSLEFHQYFQAIQCYANKINISRAMVPFVNFAGADPKSFRPTWLHVSRRHGLKPLTAGLVLKELDRFGSLDVKVLDSKRVLVATGHTKVAQRIVDAFRRHKQLKIRKYYPVFDSPRVRTVLWAGGLATIATLVFGGMAAVYYKKGKLDGPT